MAFRNLSSVLIVLACFLCSTLSFCSVCNGQCPPYCVPSSVAYNELLFWSKNVHNNMPKVLLSKLSPMSKNELSYFNSLLSTQHFVADARFCSSARLACSFTDSDPNQHLTDASQSSKTIKYKPYGSYVANISQALEMIKFRPYGPYAHTSVASEQSSFKEHLRNVSVHEDSDDQHVFFRLSALKIGNRVHLPKALNHRFPHRSFLPFPIAKQISMSSDVIKRLFPRSFDFPAIRDAILSTIFYCDSPAIRGEAKSCPKSLGDMIDFSKAALGGENLSVLTTESREGAGSDVVIENIKAFAVQKLVACHELFFPFATYFCHSVSSTNLYRITLVEAESRVPVKKVLAICHMDTSAIPADHIYLRILNLSPGQGEACHWMLETDLIWINDGESAA